MPAFDTTDPVLLDIDLALGDIRLVATDRPGATVDVRPSNPGRPADVKEAGLTLVELTDGTLRIRGPKRFSLFGRGGSVDLSVSVPTGSGLQLEAAVAELRGTGRLGRCRVKLSMGTVRLERVGPAQISTGMGDVTIEQVAGPLEVSTGSGEVRVGDVDGSAVVKNSNGATWLGTVSGDVRVNAANGDIHVDRAEAAVRARSSRGDIRVLEVASGSVALQTAAGGVDVGIRSGVAAWLDVSTSLGRVVTDLESADDPGSAVPTVEVHARTSYGDIAVHRS